MSLNVYPTVCEIENLVKSKSTIGGTIQRKVIMRVPDVTNRGKIVSFKVVDGIELDAKLYFKGNKDFISNNIGTSTYFAIIVINIHDVKNILGRHFDSINNSKVDNYIKVPILLNSSSKCLYPVSSKSSKVRTLRNNKVLKLELSQKLETISGLLSFRLEGVVCSESCSRLHVHHWILVAFTSGITINCT